MVGHPLVSLISLRRLIHLAMSSRPPIFPASILMVSTSSRTKGRFTTVNSSPSSRRPAHLANVFS
ncbi:hypothetical protein C8Q74DRAFT_1289468 [Fomes fomentarius]|nr:hypothetical protein C8Q74DRAFT_1289468 [Fomes fomentarius]